MPETATPETATPESPAPIRAFDQNGREVLVPREQWATEVLPNMLRAAWDNPDQLYMVVVNSLNEGFLEQVAAAAQQLYQTDTTPARGVCVWAATLTSLQRLVEAEMVLSTFLERNGDTGPGAGSVLVNLAKVFQAKGEIARAEATLHRALAVDPNEDNALGWLAGLAHGRAEASGQPAEPAVTAEISRIAADPRSWRAQLWLARQALAPHDSSAANIPRALQLYAEALAHAPQPVPPELLVELSGNLGNQAHSSSNPALLDDLISLTAPHFIPEIHGLQVGNNLIKANADRGHLPAASAILAALTALNQPEWNEPLAFWHSELARLSGQPAPAAGPAAPADATPQIQIGMVRIDGPVWLPVNSPNRASFAAKPASVPVVTFLGGSAESPEAESTPEQASSLDQLTRSLPLFLAEQTHMRTAASARTILPWAVGDQPAGAAVAPGQSPRPGGFIVAGQPWPDDTAVQASTQADTANPSDLVVTVHLDAEVDPWEASLVFLRTADAVRIGELSAEFDPAAPDQALLTLANEVVELLAVLGPAASSAAYTLPPGLSPYLSALERLLALRCSTMPAAQPLTPEARTRILEAARQLATPASLPTQLLLTEIESLLPIP